MKPTAEKLAALEREISSEKGDFGLFGLFLREDAQDRWDLLASASWIESDRKGALDYLVRQLSSRLEPEEILSLSRVVLLEEGNPIVKAIHSSLRAKHAMIELQQTSLSGLRFEHAYIITSEGGSLPPEKEEQTGLSDRYEELLAHSANVRIGYEDQ